MQKFDVFLRAASVKAVLVDQYNNSNSTKCSLTRGMAAEIILHLFKSENENDVFTADDLQFASWIFYADVDYDHDTTPKLVITDGITIDEDGCIHIPIDDTNTQEMAAYLGKAETKDLKAEIVGFNSGSTLPDFCLQWDISIRNRIGEEGGGSPAPVHDSNYTAAQVNALFAASNSVEYSSDGENWSAQYEAGATQRRYKNSAIPGADWTVEYLAAGAPGTSGQDGKTYYSYDGYAADSNGTDFSITPDANRIWKAEFHSTEYIVPEEIAFSHFQEAGAVWVKYIGENGNGDMSTSDYVDPEGNGVVRKASSALTVPYAGIQNLPQTFPPSVHEHQMQQISDGARQTVYAASSTPELYLNRQIIQNTKIISNGILDIDFTAVKDSSGGTAYNASAGDVFTWEYWVKANANIVSLSVGSSLTMKVLDNHALPETLPLRGSITIHAFAIRGFYRSAASQHLQLTVNYLYSTEA